jgi:hypothetical protein
MAADRNASDYYLRAGLAFVAVAGICPLLLMREARQLGWFFCACAAGVTIVALSRDARNRAHWAVEVFNLLLAAARAYGITRLNS